MPQFHYCGTWNDTWNLLDGILAPGDIVLIPDCWYYKPEPKYFTKMSNEAKTIIQQRRLLYIWSKRFSVYPLSLKRMYEGPNAGEYYIQPDHGGPCLDLSAASCYEQNGRTMLPPGMLSYSRYYFDAAQKTWLEPSKALRAGYREIKQRMKRALIRQQFPGSIRIWIGPEARQLWREDKARIRGIGMPDHD